jgi:ketosteroid isomerase-like protein
MSEETIEALARRWSLAFNERDMDSLAELTAEDFEFVPYLGSLIEANVYRGLDGLRSYFEDSHAAWEELRVRQAAIQRVDDRTISFGELHGKGRASGLEVQISLAWVGEWHGGKLSRLVAYTDKDEALKAVGLPATA